METKQFNSNWYRSNLLLFSLVVSLNIYGCNNDPQSQETLAENNVTKLVRFWQVGSKKEIEEKIVVKPGDGFYAVLELEALEDRPSVVNGLVVTPPESWPCVAICFPKGADLNSDQAIRFTVGSLGRDLPFGRPIPILAPPGPHMKPPKYQGALTLKLPKSLDPQSSVVRDNVQFRPSLSLEDSLYTEIKVLDHQFEEGIVPYWTFLGPTHEDPGEYTLEIHVFPFYTGNPSKKAPLGPAVIAYKGTLLIVE